jgi:hypothetical protein
MADQMTLFAAKDLGYLGEALWRSGRADEAVLMYQRAYRLSPSYVDEAEMTCRLIPARPRSHS